MQLKGGFTTIDPRLDRVPEFDEKSRNYPVRRRLEGLSRPTRWFNAFRRGGWRPAPGLNQGEEGACTWFSAAHRINGSPKRHCPPITEAQAHHYYKEAQKIDEWPGEAYSGSSVLAACKVAVSAGYASGFDWVGAGSGDVGADVIDTLRSVGGINFGLGWTNSMFTPRPSGLLEVTGDFVGGHAVYGFQHSWREKLTGEGPDPIDVVWLQQSWGPSHGVSRYKIPGCVCIRTDDLVNKLLLASGDWRGEGAVLVEV